MNAHSSITSPALRASQISPELQARILDAGDRLRGQTLVTRTKDTFWGVPLHVCRAFIWANYSGEDPVIAIGRAHFGKDQALFDGDATWGDAQRRPQSRTHLCVTWATHLATFGVRI